MAQAAVPVLTAEALARTGEHPIVLKLKDRPKVAMQKAIAGTDVLTLAMVPLLDRHLPMLAVAPAGCSPVLRSDHRLLAKR